MPCNGTETCILKAISQSTQGGVIHCAVHFLTVTGDEGDSVALIKQADYIINMALGTLKLPGQNLRNSFQVFLLICIVF